MTGWAARIEFIMLIINKGKEYENSKNDYFDGVVCWDGAGENRDNYWWL